MLNLSKEAKISQAFTVTAGAAGTADVTGATLDMQDWESVTMVVQTGAIVSGAVTSIKAQQGAASDMSDAADLLGSGQTIADTDDDKTFYIDIYRPRERYVRVIVDRGTQNATVAGLYVQYGGGRKLPSTHGTSVSGEMHREPAEGAA